MDTGFLPALARDDLERLLAIIQHLAYPQSMPSLTELVGARVRAAVGADGVSFVLSEGTNVFYADEDAIAPMFKGRRFASAACVSGWCIAHREPVVIPDIEDDPRVPVDVYRPTFVRSLALVPIRRDAPIGAVGAYWAERHETTARELAILQAIADAIAIALDNERLRLSEQYARAAAEGIAREQQRRLEAVAHDLRAPLNAVALSTALILKDANGDPRHQKLRRNAEVIQRSAARMERLVAQLLDVVAIEAGALRLHSEATSVARLLEEARDLEPLAIEKQQQLTIDHASDDLVVSCDVERVSQVLTNLITNAIKFSPSGAEIRVHARVGHDVVELAVEDDGPGIPEALLPRIFDRFVRGAGSDGSDGVGLGLAIAHGIVAAHGHTLMAANLPTRGASFRFSLPRLATP